MCVKHVVWVHIWAPKREKYKRDHDLRSRIKTKLRAEDSGGSGQRNDAKSDRTGGGFYPRCLALTQGSVESQPRNYARGCTGPKKLRTPDGTNAKRNLQRTRLTHTRPPFQYQTPTPSPPSSLHCIIPLMLSQGLSFVVAFNATSMAFEGLQCRKRGGVGGWGFNLPLFFLRALISSSPRCRFFQVTPSGLLMRPP